MTREKVLHSSKRQQKAKAQSKSTHKSWNAPIQLNPSWTIPGHQYIHGNYSTLQKNSWLEDHTIQVFGLATYHQKVTPNSKSYIQLLTTIKKIGPPSPIYILKRCVYVLDFILTTGISFSDRCKLIYSNVYRLVQHTMNAQNDFFFLTNIIGIITIYLI